MLRLLPAGQTEHKRTHTHTLIHTSHFNFFERERIHSWEGMTQCQQFIPRQQLCLISLNPNSKLQFCPKNSDIWYFPCFTVLGVFLPGLCAHHCMLFEQRYFRMTATPSIPLLAVFRASAANVQIVLNLYFKVFLPHAKASSGPANTQKPVSKKSQCCIWHLLFLASRNNCKFISAIM